MGGKVPKSNRPNNSSTVSNMLLTKRGNLNSQNKIINENMEAGNKQEEENFKITQDDSILNSQRDSEKIQIKTSKKVSDSKGVSRLAQRKEKIVIDAKPVESCIKSDLTEVDILQVVKANNYQMEDEKMINNCIGKHFFMRSLDKSARKEIIREMTLCKVNKGDVLFKQGSLGSFFYIVKEGGFELYINDKFIKNLYPGDNFGELALLHGAPRSGKVVASVDSFVYCLERRNFRKIVDHINSINYEENLKFLNYIPIVATMENDLKSVLASQMIREEYESHKFVVKEGDIASCMYIIKEGEVECSSKGKIFRNLKKGDHFGEKSILLESSRTLDVITLTSSVIYAISVDTLRNMTGEKYKEVLYLNFIRMAFQKSKFFSKINMKLLDHCFDCFNVYDYRNGETVLETGHIQSSKVMIVIEGGLVNPKINQVVGKRGDILFEEQLSQLSKDKLSYNLTADPDCLMVEIATSEFINLLGGANNFKELLKKSNCLDSLYKIPLFKNFPQKKIEILSNMMNIEKFENGKKIIIQGETGDKFYIVKSGKVDIYINSNYIRTMNMFEYFGERALFFKEARTATAQANGTVELYVIQAKEFKTLLEENLMSYLKNRFYLQDNTIELKDLDYVRELGQGSFGSVVLVKHRKNKYEYAIKSVSKTQIDYEQLHSNLDLERGILLKVDHPFIVKLVKTLKTEKMIFFLMEYIKGKELFEIIREIGLLDKSQAQFYSASLMLAIDYLHERKCVYRDIKPENVMVSENGFLKLIDFGTVKEISDRTTTIVGTPHYMSPEVIMGEGYSLSVDFWSIAVCMYEFVCGDLPFGANCTETMDVYLEIINSELKFPSFVKDRHFISLLKKMLTKSPINRLCKFSQIKNEPWFTDFSFENLLSLNMGPPYVPNQSNSASSTSTNTSHKSSSKLNESSVAFVNYIKTIKDYIPPKDAELNKNKQSDYDKWFKNF